MSVPKAHDGGRNAKQTSCVCRVEGRVTQLKNKTKKFGK